MRYLLLLLLLTSLSGCAYNETHNYVRADGDVSITCTQSTEKPVKVSTDLEVPMSAI